MDWYIFLANKKSFNRPFFIDVYEVKDCGDYIYNIISFLAKTVFFFERLFAVMNQRISRRLHILISKKEHCDIVDKWRYL